ncbi:hypothetical protein [Sorangium sp. So ce204]|uniref:hypothetical protein n=1 Tax=Sorangium sp. So ce204 TaxID=3133288 RepID=UPI003F61CC05
MTPDPIVDEVRAIRDAIAKEHDYDIDAIFEALRRQGAAGGTPTVPIVARRTPDLQDSPLPDSPEEPAEQGTAADDVERDR